MYDDSVIFSEAPYMMLTLLTRLVWAIALMEVYLQLNPHVYFILPMEDWNDTGVVRPYCQRSVLYPVALVAYVPTSDIVDVDIPSELTTI